MRYFIVLISVIAIIFCGCSGRTTKQEALKKAVVDFKAILPLENTITYVPETYTEIKTDTSMANGYRVYIKNYVLMEAPGIAQKIANTQNKTYHFRQFASEITVYKQDKLIFNDVIDVAFFKNHIPKNNTTPYLYKGITLDELSSLEHGAIYLTATCTSPATLHELIFGIAIDANGKLNTKQINYART